MSDEGEQRGGGIMEVLQEEQAAQGSCTCPRVLSRQGRWVQKGSLYGSLLNNVKIFREKFYVV